MIKTIPAKGYVTQSPDTYVEAELIQFQLWREMSPRHKLDLIKQVYQKGCNRCAKIAR